MSLGVKLAFFEMKQRKGKEASEGRRRLEPALLATDSAVLYERLGIREWGLYTLTERGARGTKQSDTGIVRVKDELVAVMEGSMVCGGGRKERAEAAGKLHGAHPEGWDPFLIELEDAKCGWQLWPGGVGAVEVTPEVGGHVSKQ